MIKIFILSIFLISMINFIEASHGRGKSLLLFNLTTIPFVLFSFAYIDRTWIDLVWQDGFIPIPTLEKLMSNNFLWRDVFVRFGEHYLIGYQLVFILNALLFKLNMLVEPAIFVVSSYTSVLIIYTCWRRDLEQKFYFQNFLIILAFSICFFGLTVAPGALMSTQFVMGTVLAILIGSIVDNKFKEGGPIYLPQKKYIFFAFLLFVYFFFFSGAYFVGLVSGVACLFLFKWIIVGEHSRLKNIHYLLLPIVFSLVYVVFLKFDSIESDIRTNLYPKAYDYQFVINFIYSVIAAFGSSLVNIHAYENSPVYSIWLGLVLALIILFSALIYIRNKLFLVSYMPVYCFGYAIGIICSVYFGRGSAGYLQLTNEWYGIHTRFIEIATIWALMLIISSYCNLTIYKGHLKRVSNAQLNISILSLMFIFSCNIYSTYAQWERGIHVKKWLNEKRMALILPEVFGYDKSSLLAFLPPGTQDYYFKFMKDYKLSSFSNEQLRDFFKESEFEFKSLNWYSDGWIGPQARTVFLAEEDSYLDLIVHIAERLSPGEMQIKLNGITVKDKKFMPGDYVSISRLEIPKGINMLELNISNSFNPLKIGINSDERNLSAHIDKFIIHQ